MKYVYPSVLLFVLLASAAQIQAQVTVLAGSVSSGTTNTFSYTPPAGYNRLVVLAVSRRYSAGVSTVSTIDYGTAGTGSFTLARGQTSSTTLRTELWYLPESEIRDGGYCGATITITWANNTNSQSQTYTIMTLNNVDQSAINAVANGATANAQNVQCALTAQQAVDMVVYASASVANENHTPNDPAYFEEVQVSGTTHTLALATNLDASAAETPRANWPAPSNQIGIVAFVVNGLAAPVTGTTFYSLRNGNWDDNTTWSFTENGSGGAVATGIWPRRTDNVVIKGLHTVTINAVDDNKTCGISANSLNIANVGAPNGVGTPFDNSASSTFYQSGNVGVTGTLYQSNGGINMMTSGTTTVVASGALNVNQDFYNIGYFEVMSGGTFSTLGNFVISGTSTALINNNISIGDDFGIDFTSATICGSGVASLQLGVGSAIVYTNPATSASHAAQFCSAFVVTCPGGGCSNFPVAGTGTTLVGNSGPAGIGESTNNRLWLRSTDISQATNTAVQTWTDASGNGLNATQASAGLRPKFFTNVVNTTIPVVRFDGATLNYLTVGQSALLDFTPRVDVHSFFAAVNIANNAFGTIICRATSANRQWQYTSDQTTLNRFGYFRGADFSTGSQVSTAAWKIPEAIVGTNATTGFTAFVNGTSDVAATTLGTAVAAGTDVLVGARRNNDNTDAAFYLTGDIGEIILYDVQLSTVHRVLIENYLAAKFNLAVATEVYTRDGAGYDFEVAGIGQVAAGGSHKDAKGPGIVRMWNPSGLGDAEYLVWGHDNATLISTTTAAAPIVERLTRIWALTMTGDVGTVSISFDLSAFPGTFEASELRLMIDRDNNFANNSGTDVLISGGSMAGRILTFTAVDFNDGDRFTLGNVSAVNLLPIGLVEFHAVPDRDVVKLNWSTMSEHNNDFFTVERSINGESWDDIAFVKGAGTSSKTLRYTAVDDSPVNGVSYYRLRQNDLDGKFTYSNVQRVELEGTVRLNVFPNPSQGSFTITGSDDLTLADVQMLDILGRPVAATVTRQTDSVSVDPTGVAAGVYFIRVTTGEWARTVRVVHE